jgi:hypothetical protein
MVQDFYHQRELLDLGGMTEGDITVAPAAPALRAASVIAAIGRRTTGVKLTVGEVALNVHYLPPSPVPVESFFYLTPRGPGGFSIERQQVFHLPKRTPACRERGKRRDVASATDLKRAAAEVCAGIVDCVDHIEFSIAPGQTFAEIMPWLTAAMDLVHFRDLRFVAEGTPPFPDAAECADAGGH